MNSRSANLYLAFEAPMVQSAPSWPVANHPAFSPVRVHGGMDDSYVGLLAFALAEHNLDEVPSETVEVLRQLNALSALTLPGGLVVEEEEIKVQFGCCSGLEEWRELRAIFRRESPWMGHDPNPWCEFVDEEIVRFWAATHSAEQPLPKSVEIAQGEVLSQINRFLSDLTATMECLRAWLDDQDFSETGALVDKFGRSFAITAEEPLAYILDEP